jgi:hypothetical protein
MNAIQLILLYFPFPYWGAFVLLLYRHGLSRLRHPVRDDGSLGNWWAVLNQLGLLNGRLATRRRRRHRSLAFYLAVPSASFGLAMASTTFHLIPSAWYFLVLIQASGGVILTVATVRRVGPLPQRLYKDFLPYPRLGSRIAHLAKLTPLAVVDLEPKTERDSPSDDSGQSRGAGP